MKYFLTSIILFCSLYGCNNNHKIELTREFLQGNWCYIDSVCNSDEDYFGYRYYEECFCDSVNLTFIPNLGIGPFYSEYIISNDSIAFLSNNNKVKVEIIDKDNILINATCIYNRENYPFPYTTHLIRMKPHSFPLKSYHNDDDFFRFLNESRKRMFEFYEKELFSDVKFRKKFEVAKH